MERQCVNCAEAFIIDIRHLRQKYCAKKECQSARRNLWQREKLKQDADYRANQTDAQRRWREKHPDYWKNYRAKHPGYVERNRAMQKQRRQRCSISCAAERSAVRCVAKMDVAPRQAIINSGLYRLLPVQGHGVAKMDVVMVQLIKMDEVAASG